MHRWQYRSIVIRFAVVASQICEITRNSEKIWTYSSSRSSKVINLAANRKRICHFLLVVNNNFGLSRTLSEILTHKARRALTRDRPHCPLTSSFQRTRPNIRTNLISQKLESLMPKIYTADSMCLCLVSLLVFTQLFSEAAPSQPAKPARKQNLTPNSPSTSFKVIYFGVTGKAAGDQIILYNNVGLIS